MFGNIEWIADTTDTVSFSHQKTIPPKYNVTVKRQFLPRMRLEIGYDFKPQWIMNGKTNPKIGYNYIP